MNCPLGRRTVRWLAIYLLGACVAVSAAHACTGDCNANGEVAVNEVVTGVNIALGNATVDACLAFDRNGDGAVTIDEILGGVSALLGGCPATPTPRASETTTATPTVTQTPSATPTPNLPPVLPVVPVYRTYPGYPILLPIDAMDPDGDSLTYAAGGLPDGAEIDPAGGFFRWTPSSEQVGAFAIPFSVTDSGEPPQTVHGELAVKVSPEDACVAPVCDPAGGCESPVVPVGEPCCADPVSLRVPEPASDCPGGRVMFVGRNRFAGFGHIRNCDRLLFVLAGQSLPGIRVNIETRCLRVLDAPLRVAARLTVAYSPVPRVAIDSNTVVNMQPRADGYAERLSIPFFVETGPLDFEGREANLTVTVTDFDGVQITQSYRVILTLDSNLPDLPETP